MAYRNKIALVYLLGFALDLVNMFAAAIAYPQISQQLHASVTQLAWIGNAYMLGLTLIIFTQRVAGSRVRRKAPDHGLTADVQRGVRVRGPVGLN